MPNFLTSFLDRLRRRAPRQLFATASSTSVSDVDDYRTVCKLAAETEAFGTFRRNPTYKGVLEHVRPSEGSSLLEIARTRFPDYPWAGFSRNDEVGGAELVDYPGIGKFAPTTARYIKILSDLELLFGSLDDLSIVEIGGGYGGQARIIYERFKPASYQIFDLPEPAALTRRYLGHFGLPATASADVPTAPLKVDLVISNYALSEIRRPLQEVYFSNVVANASRGFMLWNAQVWTRSNFAPEPDAPMPDTELASRIAGANVVRSGDLLGGGDERRGNTLVTWGAPLPN